ncbi:MAG: alanine/ornithine racemase family PLP-dependent enzyme [Colwellia sp.]|nr:alanine/ornithine racemase family PLP-dependent enzyme [Colwellia sp.]
MYPSVNIKLSAIKYNVIELTNRCKSFGIEVAVVVKLVCGDSRIIKMISELDVTTIADSRLENFEKMKWLKSRKLLLRFPMLSQIERVVDFVDVSLNSEIEIIKKIANVAILKEKIHDIILMVDLGDLREGIIDIDVLDKTITEINALKGINLVGIGTNLSCFGGVIPSKANLTKFIAIKNGIENKHNFKFHIISGGNSGCLNLLDKKLMPAEVNQLRLGESIFMGTGLNNEKIQGLKYNAFTLEVEIIEVMNKPSIPIGEIGLDAFGEKPVFEDLGIRRKALCAIGRQDINSDNLRPLDEKIKVLGMSSDHLILDITEVEDRYKLGDCVKFDLSYGGVLSVMNSNYVNKVYY